VNSYKFVQELQYGGVKLSIVSKGTPQYMLSERSIQTLCNMTRCILKQPKLPKVSWSEALCDAVYILNNLPKRRKESRLMKFLYLESVDYVTIHL
jgi:hypothetical protein